MRNRYFEEQIHWASLNICSRKQMLPDMFYNLRTTKNFQMTASIHVQLLEVCLMNSLPLS